MSYRSVGSLRRLTVELAAAVLLVAACSRGDAAGSSGKSAAAVASTASAAPAATSAPDSINARADRGRILGDSNAKVWLVMASDFQCPFCKQWHDASIREHRAEIREVWARADGVPQHAAQHPPVRPARRPKRRCAPRCRTSSGRCTTRSSRRRRSGKCSRTRRRSSTRLRTTTTSNMDPWRTCMSQHLTQPLHRGRLRSRAAGGRDLDADVHRRRHEAGERGRRRGRRARRGARRERQVASPPPYSRQRAFSGPARISRAGADRSRRGARHARQQLENPALAARAARHPVALPPLGRGTS